ncbi:MAG: zf-HC2 domain-containing protein [Planctomycetota bacterium]|nr:zf-HC2 domain-containing protein [Planctomycetota bacterium]
MDCPRTHEWYELERGDLAREHAERLRRHIAECPSCRHKAEGTRDVAAAMETLAGCTRVEISEESGESVLRRGRVHGLVGKGYRRPLTVRLMRSRWVRRGLPLAVAIAGVVLIVIGLRLTASVDLTPRGALERLAQETTQITQMSDLRRLAPLVRAAVTEEMARPQPSSDQVADLLLASYIGRRPREDRQVADFQFLVAGVWARLHEQPPVASAVRPAWPMLASIVLAQAVTPAGAAAGAADPLGVAKSRMLSGDYAGALAVAPPAEDAAVLRAWCLESLGRSAQASQVLANAKGALPTVLRADLAISSQDIAETLRQYEMLAAGNDRYWFAAGYLCRYELADASAAGVRFQRVRESNLRDYTSRTFQGEMTAAGSGGPERLFASDFDNWNTGAPAEMTLVHVHGGEFRVVDSGGRGKALEQDEISYRGAEFLVGEDDWSDYTLQFDVRVLESQSNNYAIAAAYRRADQTGYVLEVSSGRVRLVKQLVALEAAKKPGSGLPQRMRLEPIQAEVGLDEPLARGWWYTMKIRVQHVPGGVSIAGKFWRSDTEEPLTPQVVWTDSGGAGAGPLLGGVAGVQVSGARVQVDNFIITRNESVGDLLKR